MPANRAPPSRGGQQLSNTVRQNTTPNVDLVRAELEELKKKQAFNTDCWNWCETIQKQAGKRFFHVRQFINCTADEEFGSVWQKMHTDWLKVPDDVVKEFWERPNGGGRGMARATLNRRKSNVTNTIKKEFECKCICCTRGSIDEVY
jgi:hypothetical protein